MGVVCSTEYVEDGGCVNVGGMEMEGDDLRRMAEYETGEQRRWAEENVAWGNSGDRGLHDVAVTMRGRRARRILKYDRAGKMRAC
jgi:hypothetical protein